MREYWDKKKKKKCYFMETHRKRGLLEKKKMFIRFIAVPMG